MVITHYERSCIIRWYNQLDIISVRTARPLLPIARRCGSLINFAWTFWMSAMPKELSTARALLAMIFAISEALLLKFPLWEASMKAVVQRICTRQCEMGGTDAVESGAMCRADHAPAA